ncbi:MAG: hypothetical protein OXF07_08045 [Rhodobacter sp.]|nr:hypothetical protein [Rhodobacter sp.]MCY4169501.1 hypothetical protein [Rhodobacter sp.]
MPRIIVLFNLKPDVDEADYEAWARGTDAPTVKALGSVISFSVHRARGLLGSEEKSPYQYVEVLDVSDMDTLFSEISVPPMTEISAAFQAYADNPIFIVTEYLA